MLLKSLKIGAISLLLLLIISALVFVVKITREPLFFTLHEEVYQEAEIFNDLKIVVLEINSGATTPFSYEVYLVSPNESTNKDNLIAGYTSVIANVQKDGKTGVSVRYKDGYLTVVYPKAKYFSEVKTEIVVNNKVYKLKKVFYE